MTTDRYKYFRIEAREIVDGLGKGLLELERHADAEIVARLLRLAHTLKGAARIVKHRELADLAHTLEGTLAPLRDAPVAQRLDAAFALVDQMSAQVSALPAAAVQQIPAAIPAARPIEAMASLQRVDTAAIDEVLGGLGEVHAMLARLRALTDPREVTRGLEHLDREVRDVRHAVEQLRLLPASSIFASLQRTARDAALAAGKQVELVGRGGEVRLDGQVLAGLHGPFVQLVRNAVAHGIETPATRVATGKPPEGSIVIEVRLQAGFVIASCRDDGRGIDFEAVRRVAIARGLSATELEEPNLLSLLLRGGLTTSKEVSELAGRGIGLDVVRAAVAELGGEVSATTAPGGGTTFTLTVPSSLAAVAALVVEAGARVAAIPLTSIRRVSQVTERDLMRTPGQVSLVHDDIAIPFTSLEALLGGPYEQHATAVVVEQGGVLAAVGVGRTRGVEEVVARTPPRSVPLDPIVWGLALDAEGHPRPILEPAAIVVHAKRTSIGREVNPARRLPILIVDDSLTTRMLEQSILESAGYQVELATSGEEALECLTRTSYGLLLVDVEMPGMDGFTLIGELRKNPAYAATPTILVTSRNAPEDRRRGVEVGAQGYVVKSEFDQVELLAMIRKLVHR